MDCGVFIMPFPAFGILNWINLRDILVIGQTGKIIKWFIPEIDIWGKEEGSLGTDKGRA
ncbi:MAG: hypothetical protein J1E64_06595 [Acetatifactor sp.]|nr:hypothetical protein [Acetatifactor sp.]